MRAYLWLYMFLVCILSGCGWLWFNVPIWTPIASGLCALGAVYAAYRWTMTEFE